MKAGKFLIAKEEPSIIVTLGNGIMEKVELSEA